MPNHQQQFLDLGSSGLHNLGNCNGDESIKIIRNSKVKDLQTKQEGITSDDHKAPTSSRTWPGLKNPRIVRVSRAFGGKDRHSKVSTIRGLRDRRVRLSVPTAIQLYDLQDRLGLSQPSKVVDWLLNAAQHEIDKLPPLQLPPENFVQFSRSLPISHEATLPPAPPHPPNVENSHIEGLATCPQSTYWNSFAPQRTKQKEDPKESRLKKGNIIKGNEAVNAQVSLSGLLSNAMPYTSYYQWEASNAYLSQLGIHSSQVDAPSSRPLAPESQIVLCPPGIMPSMFPSYVAAPTDFDAKQFNHLQMASSASQNLPSNSTRNSLHLGGPSATPFQ